MFIFLSFTTACYLNGQALSVFAAVRERAEEKAPGYRIRLRGSNSLRQHPATFLNRRIKKAERQLNKNEIMFYLFYDARRGFEIKWGFQGKGIMKAAPGATDAGQTMPGVRT
ncbi:hypothetical protein [Serratia liquefaciens]|uniref:hypothetical protein n=1 Tax=Serratia liquefaciens TaxID=614 RepID=UPI0005C9C8F6|nr:hypothetical protein [Serratia liquefaciens]